MEIEEYKERIAQKIGRVRQEPSFADMVDFVRTLDECVVDSATTEGIRMEMLPLVRDIALQGAFQICFVDVSPQIAVDRFCTFVGQTNSIFSTHETLTTTSAGSVIGTRIGVSRSSLLASSTVGSVVSIELGPIDLRTENLSKLNECYAMYNLAVSTVVGEQIATSEGRQILRRLMAILGISFDDLGRMFRVSGETVRRWENGTNAIPNDRNAEIGLTKEPLNKLLEMFRPAKLPAVIRRTAELFGGERALDWILRGKITDVANRYELALRYQA